MAILKVAILGNPVLRAATEPVKNIQAPEIQRLIDDMIETMREYRGIGLAAPRLFDEPPMALPSPVNIQPVKVCSVRGSVTVKQVRPACEAASIVPPWACTIWCTMNNPSPNPWC